jgi:AAA+ ATPase superfamily predicted ATPase
MDKYFTLVPVYGDGFVGRKDAIKDLVNEITDPRSKIGFCLHGRRRVGKTSILKELEYEVSKNNKIIVAYLSLYEMADLTLKTFTEQLAAAVLEAFRAKGVIPLEYTIETLAKSPKEVISSALSKLRIGTGMSEELRFFLEFRKEKLENYTEVVKRAFDLGEKLAAHSENKFVLILDEFPEILKIENGLQIVKMFRTLHEKQKNTVIIISGSEKRTLEAVALAEASPFYKQLIPKKIHPFSFEEMKEFLTRYGVKLAEADIKKLYEVTEGVPFYLQYIGRSVTKVKDMDSAVNEFLKEEGNVFFSEEFEKLSDKEKIIAIAIAKGAVTPSEISKSCGEAATSVSRYMVTLQAKDVVNKTDKATYVLVDKLFSLWMKGKYSQ